MATGGITLNGSTQYLNFANKVVSGFPFTFVCWVAQTSAGSSQFVINQQQSSADRFAGAFLDSNGTDKYASLRNPGNSDSATKAAAPHPSAALQLMVVVFASTTSRTCYFGNNTGVASTVAMTDDITNHDRLTIGAWHSNGGAAGLFLNGTVAEAHVFNTALTSSDVTTLLTTPPEDVAGWVDGWKLASNTDLTSIGGSRTLTAIGSPTTASLTLPYTRASAPTLTSPTVVSTGSTVATVRATTDTAPTGSAILAVQVLSAATADPSSAAILASPTQTITSGASGARDFSLTGLTNGAAVKAHFTQTGGNVVSTASFTPNTTVPGAPTIGTAVAGNAQATVNGTAPASNGGSAITGYRSTATPGGSTVTGASLPINHTGLTNLTAYTFTLAAQNAIGFGPESAASNSATPSAGGVTFSGTVPSKTGSVGTAFAFGSPTMDSYFVGAGTYALLSGTLPPGLTVNSSTGAITGTPSTAGTYSGIVVRKTAASGSPATADANAFAITISTGPTVPGFDFDTAAGLVFGSISGSLVGLGREVGVSITTLVYSQTAPFGLVATLPATATNSSGRLPRLTDAALSASTSYRLVFVWPDGSAYTINMAAA